MTAEFAIALPAVMSVLMVLLATFSIQLQRFDLAEQAAMLARAAARAESAETLGALAGSETEFEITNLANLVCAKVQRPVQILNLSAVAFKLADEHCARAEGL